MGLFLRQLREELRRWKVASAVNDLRVNAVDDQPAKLATLEQGQRIEILKRYISELNRDQGLGVLILKKRITFTLVMGMLIQTVSAMVVINTTLMSIVHAEKDEEAAGEDGDEDGDLRSRLKVGS